MLGRGRRVIVSARCGLGKDRSVRRVREAMGDLVDVVVVDVLLVVVVVVTLLFSSSNAPCRSCKIILLSFSIRDNGRLIEGGGVLGGVVGSLGTRPKAFKVSGMSGLGRLILLGSPFDFFASVACCASSTLVVASLFRLSSSSSGLSLMASSTTVATLWLFGMVTDTFSFPSGPHDMVGGPCGPLIRLRTSSSRKLST